MSGMSRGPVVPGPSLPVPAVPASVPSIREAVPTGPRSGPQFAPTGPLSPPYGGDRGPGPVTGATRTPRIRVHPPCHQPILAGLDANRCALSVMVDPYPLTPAGEVWALQSGRRTYALSRGELERRDRWSIPGRPPSPKLPVLVEHACDTPVPPEHRAPPPPSPPRPATPEEIPW